MRKDSPLSSESFWDYTGYEPVTPTLAWMFDRPTNIVRSLGKGIFKRHRQGAGIIGCYYSYAMVTIGNVR